MPTADPRAAVRDGMAAAASASAGSLTAAGAWCWRLTGPRGTIVIRSRGTWPHRKLRAKIRERTGMTLPGQPPPDEET